MARARVAQCIPDAALRPTPPDTSPTPAGDEKKSGLAQAGPNGRTGTAFAFARNARAFAAALDASWGIDFNPSGAIDRMDADHVMRRYASGEAAAFDELYAALSPRLYSFCVRLAGRTGDAEDLFQEAFLKLHRSRATYVSGASVLHWAFAIVRSTHLDQLRRRGRRPEKLVASTDEVFEASSACVGSPESDLHAQTLARIVEQELQGMSEKNRSAYILLKIEGLTAAEAAAVLGTTGDAVKQRAFRAYEALREALSRAGWGQVTRA